MDVRLPDIENKNWPETDKNMGKGGSMTERSSCGQRRSRAVGGVGGNETD